MENQDINTQFINHNKQVVIKSLESATKGLIYILIFSTPLFFLPITPRFYEFNKQALLVGVTLTTVILWIVATSLKGNIKIKQSQLNFAWILILTSALLSTFFGGNMINSILGAYGNWQPSLISTLCYVVFFFIAINSLTKNDIGKVIKVIIGGGFVATLVGLCSVTKIISTFLLPEGTYPWAQSQLFNTMGGILPLAIVSVVVGILSLASLVLLPQSDVITTPKQRKTNAVFYTAAAIASVIFIILTAIPQVIAIAIISIFWLVVLLTSTKKQVEIKSVKTYLVCIVTTAIVVVLAGLSPDIQQLGIKNLSDAQLDPKSAWIVASSTISQQPLFGGGLGSFGSSFNIHRPTYLNAGANWSVRFNRASSEYIETLATSGIFGLLALVLLLFRAGKIALATFKTDEEGTQILPLLLTLTIASSYLITSSTTTTYIFLVAGLASIAILSKSTFKEVALSKLLGGVFVAVIALAGTGYYGLYQVYAGEYYQKQALDAYIAGDIINSYNLQQQAISMSPYRDVYHTNNATLNLDVALTILESKEEGQTLTDEENQQVSALVSQAVEESKTAVQLDVMNTNNWISQGNIYRNLVGIAEGALEWSRVAYYNATQTDPTNPITHINLGQVFLAEGNNVEAIRSFAQAVVHKNNLIEGHYHLSRALYANKNLAEAVAEMGIALRLSDPSWEVYEQIKTELEELITQYNETIVQEDLPEGASTAEGQTISTDDLSTDLPLSNEASPSASVGM